MHSLTPAVSGSARRPTTVALYPGHLAAAGRPMASIEQARTAISHFRAAGMQRTYNLSHHPVSPRP